MCECQYLGSFSEAKVRQQLRLVRLRMSSRVGAELFIER